MNKKKMKLLTQRQTETIEDAKAKIKKYNCCAIVRPTGFGKTRTLAKFIGDVLEETRDNDYSKLLGRGGVKGKSVLFVYPTEIIRQTMESYEEPDTDVELDEIDEIEYTDSESTESFLYNTNLIKREDKNTRFDGITYSMFRKRVLTNDKDEVIKDIVENYSLIVFDEMHFMGARLVKEALNILKPALDKYKVRYIGATATEIRMDKFNVIQTYFDGNLTYHYDKLDMVRDGLIEKPYYVYTTYYTKALMNYVKKKGSVVPGKQLEDKEALKIVNKIKDMYDVDKILKRNIEKLRDTSGVDISYMKFISFHLTIDDIQKNIDKVRVYFKLAFPDYTIRVHEIYSATKKSNYVVDDVSKLKTLKRQDKTIDLIFSCNMLNYGYHVKDLTGVLMFRHTKSPVIYAQQMGRPITVESDVPAIIFDFVYNLDMAPIYKYFLYDLNYERKEEENTGAGRKKVCEKDDTEYGVVLVDELRDIFDIIKSSSIVGKDVLEKAEMYYYATDEANSKLLKYAISVGELSKVFSCSMEKDFIKHLVSKGLPLQSYDLEKYGPMYNVVKNDI